METRLGQYVVFIDIDGTLMGSCEALKKNLSVIQKVRSLGHKVLINTGRATSYIPSELKDGKFFDGVISGAGAIVKLGGQVILKKLIPYEAVISMCKLLLSIDEASALEGEENMYHFDDSEYADKVWIKLDKDNYDKIITKDTPIEKFTIFGKAPQKILDFSGEEYAVLQHAHYCEIIRRDCSKALAMQCVMENLGLPMSRSIAIGDSMNDYDMIKASGIGVAMGNAIDEIKEISDIITVDADNAGVSEALCKIFGI